MTLKNSIYIYIYYMSLCSIFGEAQRDLCHIKAQKLPSIANNAFIPLSQLYQGGGEERG